MITCRNLPKRAFILSALLLLLPTTVRAAFTANLTAAILRDSSGNPMPVTGLVMLVASTNDAQFVAPTASSFVSGDDIIIKKWDLSAFQDIPGVLFDTTGSQTPTGGWGTDDPLAIYWFPTLTISSTAPGVGAPYGFYTGGDGTDGSARWFTPDPNSAATIYLKFLTVSANGSNPDSAGNASLTVIGDAPPVANPDSFSRQKNMSLEMLKSDLMANDTGTSISFTSVNSPSTQGATLTASGLYVFYTPVNNINDTFTYTITDGHSSTATGTVTVNVVSQGGIAQTPVLTNGTAVVRFAGIPGYAYEVQRASAVEGPYTNVLTTNAPSSGMFIYVDDSPPSPSAFYRLMAQ